MDKSSLRGKGRNTFKDRATEVLGPWCHIILYSVDGVTGLFTFLVLGDRCTFDMFCGIWPVLVAVIVYVIPGSATGVRIQYIQYVASDIP